MIAKKIILSQEYNMNGYTKNQILSLYNPFDKNIKEVMHAVSSINEKTNSETLCKVSRKIQKVDGLIIESFESNESSILGTNLYISYSLIGSVCPLISKTVYIDPKLFLFVYPDTEEIIASIDEIERITLYVMAIMKNLPTSGWKVFLKSYIDSNFRFITPENRNIPIIDGEKYVFIGKNELFCNSDEFEDGKDE